MSEPPRILFVPVSGSFGMGEYARSLAIAKAAQARWQDAEIHFVLSRQAPYASAAPFPCTLLASSPTFNSAAMIAVIERFRPHVVIFDNAGRTRQLRAACNAAARVIFISARARQRRKAFRWRWMRLIDEHWIAYPEFIAGRLNAIERIKLALLHRPRLRYLDVVLSSTAPGLESILSRSRMESGTYALVVPGGGTGHPGVRDAPQAFLAAANALAQSGLDTVFVGACSALPSPRLRCFDTLPQADLADLMRGAALILANGGSTLLQAIACGRPCVAVAVAQDQFERIRRCTDAHVAIQASLDPATMVRAVQGLWCDDAARVGLAARAAALGLADGVEIALGALARLLERA